MEVTTGLVFRVLDWLDVDYHNSDEEFVQLPTICHGGDSHKLYFYKNSNKLVCFTNCGTMDIFEFIAKVKNISKAQAFKIVVNNFDTDVSDVADVEDNPAKRFKRATESASQDVKVYDDKVLNHFYDFNIERWNNENISYPTQDKFEIRYSIEDNAIIIPHRDYHGNLVGIRQRNLSQKDIDMGIKYIPTRVGDTVYKYPTGYNLYGYYYNQNEIRATKKVILFEAEKSVMMMDSYYHDNNFSVALSGHNLTRTQIEFLNTLPIDEIVIALDKDFRDGDNETKEALEELIIKKYSRLTNRFNVSIIWDTDNLLDYKDSPTDKGKDVFDKLFKERRYLI